MIQPEKYTCSICGKSFEKRISQIRHISYCRKSKSCGRSRKKACLACTKAKTYCDAASPGCSRCAAKNLTCHYDRPPRPVSRATAVESSNSSSDNGISLQEIPALPLGISSGTSIELIQSSQNGPAVLFTNFLEQPGSTSVISDMYDISFTSSMSNQDTREILQLSYTDPSVLTTGTLDTEAEEEIFTFSQLLPNPPRGFFPRAVGNHQFSLARKYMLATLRSYPFAMLPGKSHQLPMFIHPQCLSSGSRDEPGSVVRHSLSSPLENCLAIVQMWSVKNEANAAFIWRTIRLEQERLFFECSKYDDWTTVTGLQAITVYFLLRVAEHDDQHMDFDLPLIRTMIKLARHSHEIGMRYSPFSDGGSPSWEAWVLVESLRRTVTVLFLINILFDYSTLLYPYVCDGSELLHTPLPCGRDLWQARSKHEWERVYGLKPVGKQLTYGDLVNSRFRTDRKLDSWLEQLDDFGSLVVAAASLGDN